jgi:hypothetical protein
MDVAVNAHHLGELVAAHVAGRAHVSMEPELLGSSGAVAYLKGWINGRAVLVLNGDIYLHGGDLSPLLDGWGRHTVRMLVVPAGERAPEFGDQVFAGASLLPWPVVCDLPKGPSDLVRTVWRPAEVAGHLELCPFPGTYLDCGTPADFRAADALSRLEASTDPGSPR